jgi:hypothetical protein
LVVFWANPSLAQDIHNGPVAIRPMVTAPQLMGKTPPIQKINHCPEERAQLKETWHNAESQMANGDDVAHGHTPAQLKARYIYGDKIIASVIDAASEPWGVKVTLSVNRPRSCPSE